MDRFWQYETIPMGCVSFANIPGLSKAVVAENEDTLMDKRTSKRSIVIVAVWMVVLSVNASAAYVVIADSPHQRQSDQLVMEDGQNPPADPHAAIDEGTDGKTAPNNRRSGSSLVTLVSTVLGLDRTSDAGRSGNVNGHDGNRAANERSETAENSNSGPPNRHRTTCTSGKLLAKYELHEGGFVFEKGTDTITTTDVVYDENGELRSFAFESTAFVSTAIVKFGPETRTVEIHGRIGTVDLTDEKHAISNVVFCQNSFYQVDFVTGTPIEQLSANHLYGDRKIQFMGGVVGADEPQRWSAGDHPACLGDVEQIEIIDDGTAATVTFVVKERCTLSFVSYETQSIRFDRHTAHRQVLVDSVTRTFEPGRYEVIVSLPDATNSSTTNGERGEA